MWFDEIKNVSRPKSTVFEQIASHNLPVIVYGCGGWGSLITRALGEHGIEVESYVVDPEYFRFGQKFLGKPVDVLDLEKVSGVGSHVYVLAMTPPAGLPSLRRFMAADIIKYVVFEIEILGFGSLTYDFLRENIKAFDETFTWLCDDLSRETFIAFLNMKISGDITYNFDVCRDGQYFNELTAPYKGTAFVDCGAYHGDTAEEFARWSGGTYEKIYSFEPDEKNRRAFDAVIREKGLLDIEVFPIGLWDEQAELTFTGGVDDACAIKEGGGTTIKVDSIDNVLECRPVGFIKMDIEGAELRALHGAEKTIRKNHPLLAICVYHRREDLITIPQYIKSFEADGLRYKFFLRKHQLVDCELVLYAIPEKDDGCTRASLLP